MHSSRLRASRFSDHLSCTHITLAMLTLLPCMPPTHALCHTPPLSHACTYLPCNSLHHTHPPSPCTPPFATAPLHHTCPLLWTESQTGVKTLLFRNFVCGSVITFTFRLTHNIPSDQLSKFLIIESFVFSASVRTSIRSDKTSTIFHEFHWDRVKWASSVLQLSEQEQNTSSIPHVLLLVKFRQGNEVRKKRPASNHCEQNQTQLEQISSMHTMCNAVILLNVNGFCNFKFPTASGGKSRPHADLNSNFKSINIC